MKKRIKIIVNMIVISIISMLIASTTYAISFKFNITADKTEAKAGDEIVVSMNIANIDMGEFRIKCNRRNIRI